MGYNAWPNGQVPKELQRPELDQLKESGYLFDDAREVVTMFENKVAKFAGSKYAVSTDCCTHAIELSLRYLLHSNVLSQGRVISMPKNTYVSAALSLMHLGFGIKFRDERWVGSYTYGGTNIIDGAVLWEEGMYQDGTLHCVSFQMKKIIPIGRGGMILTNDESTYKWLKLASYDGRDLTLPYDHPSHLKMYGYHDYMTPEDCARGILLMDSIKQQGNTGTWENYPDIQEMIN